MTNENIRFFKNYNLINDKIVYVKDKNCIGYDSSNSNAFQFRYWKMKDFGMSDGFVVVGDDCFVRKKLKKTDFFILKKVK